jgi:hypothetical protein
VSAETNSQPQPGDILVVKCQRIVLIDFIKMTTGPDEPGDYCVVKKGDIALLVSIKHNDDFGSEWAVMVDNRTWHYDSLEDWGDDWEILV